MKQDAVLVGKVGLLVGTGTIWRDMAESEDDKKKVWFCVTTSFYAIVEK